MGWGPPTPAGPILKQILDLTRGPPEQGTEGRTVLTVLSATTDTILVIPRGSCAIQLLDNVVNENITKWGSFYSSINWRDRDTKSHIETHWKRGTCGHISRYTEPPTASLPKTYKHLHLSVPWSHLWGMYRMDEAADKGWCQLPCRTTLPDLQVSSLRISKSSKVIIEAHCYKNLSRPLREGRRLFPWHLFLIYLGNKKSMSGHTG